LNYAIFPPLNAALNGASAVFLTVGFLFIRNKNKAAHRFCMLSAFTTSVVFLVCYLYYHFNVGALHFTGQGWIRPVYFALLTSHTVLAALVPVLAILALTRALNGDFKKHRAIARIALPIWLYVSVTGVIVYWILYHLYPSYN
jgi:uncharacterized membrane protein YozB (DUF420 family)